MMGSTEFKKNLQVLRQKYLKRLSGQLQDCRRDCDLLAQNRLDAAGLQQLYRISHNFAGSGTTFGFPEISDVAHQLYDTLKGLLEAEPGTEEANARLDETHDRLNHFISICDGILAQTPENSPEPSAAPKAAASPAAGLTVYLLAATPGKLLPLSQQLTHFGYQVAALPHADEYKGAQEKRHVLILDSGLPEKALADIAALRALDGEPSRAPLIVISAAGDFESRLKAVRLGATGYFTEDADVLKIIDKIEQLSSRSNLRAAWHVLIIDDDEMLAQFYGNALMNAGMNASLVSSPREALKMLAERPVDLILIDFNMPHCNGQELAAIIRQQEQYVSLPIIFMSAKDDLEALLINTGLGIDDFLVKPFSPEQLIAVINSRAMRAAELRNFMVCDSFTGLFSHTHFLECLSNEVVNVKRTRDNVIYAILDIDHFKRVNDTYGHAAGDQVIKSLARTMQQRFRRTDITGRCGGEEFGVIMRDADMTHARRILESLRESFAATPFQIGGKEIRVTFSAGMVQLEPGRDLDQIINAADTALYDAKKGGRNRVIAAQ